MDRNETCKVCGKAVRGGKSASITQWLLSDQCQCGVEPRPVDQTEDASICPKCKLPNGAVRPGSMTQWIFSDMRCRCLLESGNFASPDNKSAYVSARYSPDLEQNLIDELESGPINCHNLPKDSFPFERYRIIAEKGRGNAGIVYEAWDTILKKRVAIKTLYHDAWSADDLVRFQQEAKATSRLDHHNITRILDFGAAPDGRPYMVSEFVNGPSLREIIDTDGPLDPGRAIPIFMQICKGVAHAHKHGLFHRDLKSSNVMIDFEQMQVKIIDFGIASAAQEKTMSPKQQGLTVAGSPFYMCPDQVQGLKFDKRSDIYSIGCVMFEALTGRVPFVGETAMATLSLHANEAVPYFSDVLDYEFQYGNLEDIVRRSLSKDRELRQESADVLKDELASVVEGVENVAEQAAATTPGARDNKTAIVVSILALLSFLALAIPAYQILRSPEVKKKTVVRPASDDLSDAYLSVFSISNGGEVSANSPVSERDLELLSKHKYSVHKLYLCGKDKLVAQNLTDAEWKVIAKFPLTVLDVEGSNTTDEAMPYLAQLNKLENLSLNRTQVTSKVLTVLPTSLGSLHLENTKVTSLEPVSKMKKLGYLHLSGSGVTDADLMLLGDRVPLTSLHLGSCNLTDNCATSISKLKQLATLTLSHTQVTKSGIRQLGELPLNNFSFSENPQCDDACLEEIVHRFKGLETLALDGARISKKGVDLLPELRFLKRLSLCGTRLNDSDLVSITKLDRLESLSLSNVDISDLTVRRIVQLPLLKVVELNNCPRVSDAGLSSLSSRGIHCNAYARSANHGMAEELFGEL